MKTGLCVVALLAFAEGQVNAQQRLTSDVAHDPADAVFVYADIDNYLSASDAIAGGMDSTEALRTLYFDRASPGLLMFVEKYDLTVGRLQAAMEIMSITDYPDFLERSGYPEQAPGHARP